MKIIDKNDINYIFNCTKCNIDKPNSSFTKRKETDGKRIRKYTSQCKECVSKSGCYWSKNNKEKIKIHRRRRIFGLSQEKYNSILLKQNNCCGICKLDKNKFEKDLCVDHCHGTNKIRGLLCTECNLGIANMRDSIQSLYNAIDYLQKENLLLMPLGKK